MDEVRDQSTDPRFLGSGGGREALEDRERDLATTVRSLRNILEMMMSPGWPDLVTWVQNKQQDVHRGLRATRSWDTACRLQGEAQAWGWVISLDELVKARLGAAQEELEVIQRQMEVVT